MRSLSEAQQLEDLPHTLVLFQEDRCAPIARWIEVLMDAAAHVALRHETRCEPSQSLHGPYKPRARRTASSARRSSVSRC
jgi:hypothetical protein